MDKKVQIKKTVLDRTGFKDFIKNDFNFFKEPEPIVDNDTVAELFRLYDKLYMEIPIDTDQQSHKYLVEQSSELYKVDRQLESIQPLLDEVASSRTQLLEANRNIIELEAKLASGGEISFGDAEALSLVRTELEAAQATIASLEQANAIANSATQQAQEQAAAQSQAATEAAAAAATAAATASSTSSSIGLSESANDLVKLIKKRRHKYYYVRRLIEKKIFSYNTFRRRNNLFGSRFYWLYKDGTPNYRGTISSLIPRTRRQARELSIDFFIEDASKGFKAEDIVAAVNSLGNFKDRVKMELQYDNDGELDDRNPILWRLND